MMHSSGVQSMDAANGNDRLAGIVTLHRSRDVRQENWLAACMETQVHKKPLDVQHAELGMSDRSMNGG